MASKLLQAVGAILIVAACFGITTAAAAYAIRRPQLRELHTSTASHLSADYSRDPESVLFRKLGQGLIAAADGDAPTDPHIHSLSNPPCDEHTGPDKHANVARDALDDKDCSAVANPGAGNGDTDSGRARADPNVRPYSHRDDSPLYTNRDPVTIVHADSHQDGDADAHFRPSRARDACTYEYTTANRDDHGNVYRDPNPDIDLDNNAYANAYIDRHTDTGEHWLPELFG